MLIFSLVCPAYSLLLYLLFSKVFLSEALLHLLKALISIQHFFFGNSVPIRCLLIFSSLILFSYNLPPHRRQVQNISLLPPTCQYLFSYFFSLIFQYLTFISPSFFPKLFIFKKRPRVKRKASLYKRSPEYSGLLFHQNTIINYLFKSSSAQSFGTLSAV